MATNLLRHHEIHHEMQRRIVGGICPPGSRLPTRDELQVQFSASRNTVQKALENLRRDGFISSNGKAGTFVTPNPPHLCTYGMVFPRLVVESRYFRALRTAARVVFDSESRRLRVYESVCDKPSDPHNLQLLDDVFHHRVAGVIMTWEGNEFSGSPLYNRDCDVPRVALHPTPAGSGVPSLVIHWENFFERAVERLAAQGRRKIACIAVGSSDAENVEACGALKRQGLEHRRYWHLNVGPHRYAAARTATHLMMSLAPADRPDALIIADDNLVEHAQVGLVDAGIRVGEDVSVLAHCNWPEPPAAIFPMTRLGFDVTQMMRTCGDLIDQQRRGMTPPEMTMVKPVFQEEAATAVLASAPADTSAALML